MQTFTLPRTGDAPLKFRGECLATAKGKDANGKAPNRYHELAVYRTEDDRYIVAIDFLTRWDGETDHHRVEVCGGPGQVRYVVRDHSPIPPNIGFPPTPAYADRQAKLVAELTTKYESLVSRLLSLDVFAEELGENDLASYAAIDAEAIKEYASSVLKSAFPMSPEEAGCLCDANNGAMIVGGFFWQGLAINIIDSPASSLSDKWGCDASALAGRIQEATRETKFALAYCCVQFWRSPDLPTRMALKESGFCIQEETATK